MNRLYPLALASLALSGLPAEAAVVNATLSGNFKFFRVDATTGTGPSTVPPWGTWSLNTTPLVISMQGSISYDNVTNQIQTMTINQAPGTAGPFIFSTDGLTKTSRQGEGSYSGLSWTFRTDTDDNSTAAAYDTVIGGTPVSIPAQTAVGNTLRFTGGTASCFSPLIGNCITATNSIEFVLGTDINAYVSGGTYTSASILDVNNTVWDFTGVPSDFLVIAQAPITLPGVAYSFSGGNTSVHLDVAKAAYGPGVAFNTRSLGTFDFTVTPVADTDGDGVADNLDNCRLVANPTQLDANADGYGNICDADINNSGTVTTADFGLLRSVLGQAAGFSATAAAADMNGSGTVTTADFGLLRARLGTVPGPSGLACAGTIPCP